jgi:hypothetical protein
MIRLKMAATNFAIAVLSVLLLLTAIESGLAVSKFNVPDTMRYIPGKGTTYIPHAYYRHTKEGFSEGRFNSHGFRDYERTYEKPADVFRIVVLGDSYIEAFQVQLEHAFTAQLENLLNAHPSSKRFEVISLGQSGSGTADEYIRYLNFGLAYDPDLVVLAFTTGNDFRNNSRFLSQETIGSYFAFNDDGQLVLDRSLLDTYEKGLTYPKRLFQAIKTHSHLLSLLSERLYLLNRQLVAARMSGAYRQTEDIEDENSLNVFSDLNIYRSDLPEPWKQTVHLTSEIILLFKKSVEAHGSRFVLIALSNAEQVHPEVGDALKKKYEFDFDYEQPDRILENLAQKNGISFLKLMPALREYHARTGQYVHGFGGSHEGHWNQEGHRIAAKLTFRFLKDRHMLSLENHRL